MKFLARPLKRFSREEDGLVMTEFLIMLPLLVWTFMALFIYWDAFRTINQSQKAAYAVSDLVSRQSEVDRPFIGGMEKVMEYLTNGKSVRMRITSIQWDAIAEEYHVIFSESPGGEMPKLTASDVADMADDKIPIMASGDTVVIVETEVAYTPAFDVGITAHTFDNFIVTRPRYYVKVCLIEDPLSCASAI
ncbi:hypothetical protein LHP98_12315 [Rhodobacter sp. Har01]|uniref:TadE/TadG family type IV pilus assembly protein n=1 Tax=Rhodobacter sp. Har01 TaxID=2883999 RepID=UPI001D073863|nr:hypothetical protein [Rhodobacter sp. Har01]MCB6178911.1 hypothetical protein [Rhodobacter sp. Har01]